MNMNMVRLYDLLAAKNPEGLNWVQENPMDFLELLRQSNLKAHEFFTSLPTIPSPEWFISLIIKISDPHDDSWAHHLQTFIRSTDPEVFKYWRTYTFDKLPAGKLRRILNDFLQQNLQDAGFVVARLKEERNQFHQQRLFISYRGVKYVKSYHQSSYGPGSGPLLPGDLVIFYPSSTRELAPGIRETYFQLAQRASER